MINQKELGRAMPGARQRRRWVVRITPLALAAFMHAELAFMIAFAPTTATAQTTMGSAPRTLALYVLPKTRKDEKSAQLVRGLFRSAADRFAPTQLARALASTSEAAPSVKRMDAFIAEGRVALNLGNWTDALAKYTAAEEVFKTVRLYVARDQAARM